ATQAASSATTLPAGCLPGPSCTGTATSPHGCGGCHNHASQPSTRSPNAGSRQSKRARNTRQHSDRACSGHGAQGPSRSLPQGPCLPPVVASVLPVESVDYVDTFIAVADDCPAAEGIAPPVNPASPSVAART